MAYCQKCEKEMDDGQFYTYKNKEKTELCKKCLTMHIDNFDESTFLWLLEKMDVPYIPAEWNKIRDKAYIEKGPEKMNGMSVFGKYLSKMKLNQYYCKEEKRQYGWADSEMLQKKYASDNKESLEEQRQRDKEYTEKFKNGEITENEYRTLVSVETQHNQYNDIAAITNPQGVYNPFEGADFISELDLGDPAADLTAEDKVYLALKWGRTYKPAEWIDLEKDYEEMMASFDIQDADTINTLILICKTNLKMNQAIDHNDVEGFQKLAKVSESLRKSAKFTAMQNKDDKSESVDSIGELVAMCEKEGFIPRFATDIPQDKVDFTLQDMNNYIHTLVTQDLGFGQQIEDALKKIEIQREIKEDNSHDNDDDYELEDEDYEAFYLELERQKEQDNQEEEE